MSISRNEISLPDSKIIDFWNTINFADGFLNMKFQAFVRVAGTPTLRRAFTRSRSSSKNLIASFRFHRFFLFSPKNRVETNFCVFSLSDNMFLEKSKRIYRNDKTSKGKIWNWNKKNIFLIRIALQCFLIRCTCAIGDN